MTLRPSLVLALLLTALGLDASAQSRPAVIAPRAGAQVIQNTAGTPMARQRAVVVDQAMLSRAGEALQLDPGITQQLEIPFFDDLTLTINLKRAERVGRGVTNFYGTVDGDPLGQAVVTQSRGNTAITVFYQGNTYQVRLDGEGSYVAQEIDRTNLREGPQDSPRPPAGISADEAPPIAYDSAAFIDVMVVYTARTRAAAGGKSAIENEIDNGIALTNAAYANSGVTQRVRLVHTYEMSYSGDTANADIGVVLGNIRTNTTLNSLRTTYGADLVSFWMEGTPGGATNGGCGVGYLMAPVGSGFAPYGYNVLIRGICAVANQSFPHELGHNMGLSHDELQNAGDSTAYPYSMGYVDAPNKFRTIMAYANASCPSATCTRINSFSTPLRAYGGHVTGSASTADAARALNNTANIVANFRPSTLSPGSLEMLVATKSVTESSGGVPIVVTRLGGSTGPVSVNYATASGTAIAGTHFNTTNGTLSWANGETTNKTINVPIINNGLSDGTRAFTVTLSAPTGGASLDAPAATTVTITDDEPDRLSFAAGTINFTEGAAAAINVPVNRVGSAVGAVSVKWTTSNGTASIGDDFGTLNSSTQKTGTLAWAAGDTAPKFITIGPPAANIPVINDTALETAEFFTITLSNTTGAAMVGAIGSVPVNILDNDSTIAFASGTVSVNEGGPNVTLQLVRSGSVATAQAVTYTASAGTATATSDYANFTGTVTFAIGETSKVITIGPTAVAMPYVKIVNDTTVEPPETFTLKLSAPTNGAVLGALFEAVVTIEDNDSGVGMAVGSTGFMEGSGAQQVVVNRNGSEGALSVNYAFVDSSAVNGTHYAGVNGTLNWADGDNAPQPILFTVLDDVGVSTPRIFTITLSGVSAGAAISTPSTVVSITDNDSSVQFSVASATVAEGANLALNVTRTGSLLNAATVNWSASSGTALAGVDFGPTLSGTLEWLAGVGTTQVITIPTVNDTMVEGNETFTVTLSDAVGVNLAIGANASVAVTITDNDKGFAFLQPTYLVNEGAGSVTIPVQRVGPSTGTATATWATVNGTATSGQDFGLLNNPAARTGTLSWTSGDMANKNIVIPILNDTTGGEGNETFMVQLTAGAGFVVAEPNFVVVTIEDNDLPPTSQVQFTQPKYLVTENGVTATLQVERINTALQDVVATVKFATLAGTALATSDYTTKSGTLTWAAGETGTKDITLNIVNNAVSEAPEAFKVVLSAPSAGTVLGTTPEATVVILDDDEVFPRAGAMPSGFADCACATTGWHVSSDAGAYEGLYALKSNQLEDNQTAGVEMIGTFAAGNVSFRVKVSTETTFDALRFYIDDVLQAPQWSGTAVAGWQLSPSYAITAGVHTLKWVYAKDATASLGMDAAYIDGLVTPAFAPAP